MIYGRKGSVQLKIFRNKDNNEDSSNSASSLNEEDEIVSKEQIHHENEEACIKKDFLDTSISRRNSSINKLRHIRNIKPLYLDSDDLLNDNCEEFAIDDSTSFIEHTRKRHSSHSTISNPPYFNVCNSHEANSNKRRASSGSTYKKLIELQPFKNKVGGHTEIFKFSTRAICKTLLNKENEWYESLENEYTNNNNENCGTLLKFMPKYIGILNVRKSSIETEVNLNDNIHLFSKKLLEKYYIDVDPNELSIDYHNKHTNLNVKLKDQILSEVFDYSDSSKSVDLDKETSSTDIIANGDQNKTDTTSEVTQYILLEDLTRKMKNATVLDLKMGTRQYGVYAISKKKKSQKMKCQMTTSLKLGCRVCGLKIYRPSTNSFIKKDKYFGRRIKSGWQFNRLILLFLYDGIAIKSILNKIPKLIHDLNQLIQSINTLDGYRLYGASLLFMYDENDNECKVYIIDFAQCITVNDYLEKQSAFTCPPKLGMQSPDKGFIKGLKSLKFYLKNSWDILTGFDTDVETCFLSNGLLDQKKVLKYCNDNEKFSLPFKWLDSFTDEREDSFNDADNEYRQKWSSYEKMFDLFPDYSDDEEVQSD